MIKYSLIDPNLLEHLAIRAFDEYYISFDDPSLLRKWSNQAPSNKERWRIVAATVINECANVVRDGIKAKDQR